MNNVIDKVNKVNTEATSNIGQLTDLNNKAQELSNNIQQALPINTELIKNTESAKVANTNLLATNQEATSKNTELQASLEKTKEFINGLDGGQNIPQIRMDVTELQNGLKSNQALAYKGSSISANNTLEGRTEGMRIGGRTLVNLVDTKTYNKDKQYEFNSRYSTIKIKQVTNGNFNDKYCFKTSITKLSECTIDTKYDENSFVVTYLGSGGYESSHFKIKDWKKVKIGETIIIEGERLCNVNESDRFKISVAIGIPFEFNSSETGTTGKFKVNNCIITKDSKSESFFEGIKSFGEEEQVGDKYKISILSSGKNLFNVTFEKGMAINGDSGSTYVQSNRDLSGFQKVPSNTQLILSGGIFAGKCLFNKNKKFIKSVATNNFTTTNDTYYIRFAVDNTKEYNVQLEKGTVATSYQESQQDKKDILIKEPLRENDVLYEDNGQVKVYRDVKQYTFTGDESWIKSDLSDNSYSIFYINGYKPKGKIICNNFSYIDLERDKKEGICIIGDGSLRICINNNKLSSNTVEGFKTWLKANPTTIVYQLATPTVEVVENCVDIDLDTFGEKTYFNILNSLPGTLDFKVPSNIASIVQNTAREVNNIWDVINNLLVPSLIDINKNVAMSTIKNNLK
ncbi:DUF2479 domain-containing protein [Clostridium perfringens]|uniref:DUF2479 domain-containing protein n=1 Tax=Clostridium perfringens TaxID=1502 RepID=UPI003C2B984B